MLVAGLDLKNVHHFALTTTQCLPFLITENITWMNLEPEQRVTFFTVYFSGVFLVFVTMKWDCDVLLVDSKYISLNFIQFAQNKAYKETILQHVDAFGRGECGGRIP
jgi:hypothetical protein